MVQIRAQMAGTVFSIPVNVGDKVEIGNTVMILESMKMEIPVESEVAGVVKAINVAEEDFVNEEDVLVVVEQTLPF